MSSRTLRTLPLAAALALGAAACSSAYFPSGPKARNVMLEVWNLGTHNMKALYVTPDPSYADAKNLLDAPLAPQQTVVVPFFTGKYVTVVRERNNGQDLALTTQSGLMIYNNRCTLIAFNDSFQLQGDPDRGDDDGRAFDEPGDGDPGPGD